ATRVHARRLHEAGLLSDSELGDAETALDWITVEGTVEPDDEDVHSAIERLLGTVGRKIHAGRSRNDQVAAALRLYVADACLEALEAIRRFELAVFDRAGEEDDTPMTGYTLHQRVDPHTMGYTL